MRAESFARHTPILQGTPGISACCQRRQRRRQHRGLRRRLRHVRLRASRMSQLPLSGTCQLISWRREHVAMAAAAACVPFLKGTWAMWAGAPLLLPLSLSPSPRGFCAQLEQLASLASGLRIKGTQGWSPVHGRPSGFKGRAPSSKKFE